MTPSFPSLARQIRDGAEPTVGIDVRFDRCRLRIDSNSRALVRELEDYFRPFLDADGPPDIQITALEMPPPDLGLDFVDWPRDPGKVGRKDTYVDFADGRACRKVRTGMQYLLGDGELTICGECLKNANQVVNFMISQYIAWLIHRGGALCHAAAVARNGTGLAIAAFSGGGKSTLALHLMDHGCDFISNDRTVIRMDGSRAVMAGVPKQPRINPGTILNNPALRPILGEERRREIEALRADELWALEEKYDAPVDRLFGEGRFRLNADLDGFLILNWRRDVDAPTRIDRVNIAERPDLLSAVMKPPGPFFLSADGSPPAGRAGVDPADYLPILAEVPVFEASGALDFGHAVDVCLSEIL